MMFTIFHLFPFCSVQKVAEFNFIKNLVQPTKIITETNKFYEPLKYFKSKTETLHIIMKNHDVYHSLLILFNKMHTKNLMNYDFNCIKNNYCYLE